MSEVVDLMIVGGDIYTPTGVINNGHLSVSNGKILTLAQGEISMSSTRTIDASGKLVLPGLIDIHVNGGGGSLSVDGTPEAIKNIATAHAKHGTTSLVVTTITVDDERLRETVSAIAQVARGPLAGARVLGAHLEGPFLNPEKAGAHNKAYLKPPSLEFFDELYMLSQGTIRILSLAPELEGANSLIKYAHNKGVVVGLAHSNANYDEALEAIGNGLSLCTHIFNAMPPLDHRRPGPIGAFLSSLHPQNTFVEIISDALHVHPSVMDIVIRSKGDSGVILVTDAVTPAGTDIRNFNILGVELEVRGFACYLPSGGLAGSALTMNQAVKIISTQTSSSLGSAVKMASLNPATLLGINSRKGSLEEGKDADLIITNKNLDVIETIVEGTTVYQV